LGRPIGPGAAEPDPGPKRRDTPPQAAGSPHRDLLPLSGSSTPLCATTTRWSVSPPPRPPRPLPRFALFASHPLPAALAPSPVPGRRVPPTATAHPIWMVLSLPFPCLLLVPPAGPRRGPAAAAGRCRRRCDAGAAADHQPSHRRHPERQPERADPPRRLPRPRCPPSHGMGAWGVPSWPLPPPPCAGLAAMTLADEAVCQQLKDLLNMVCGRCVREAVPRANPPPPSRRRLATHILDWGLQ